MTEHELFAAALAIEVPADRDAYLTTACAGDAALRGRVEALLRAHARAGNFLGTPAYGADAGDDTRTGPGADADLPIDFLAPSGMPGSLGRLGHYEVQGVVGRGGMGVVLKAFDANLHRVVAVKVMAPQLAAAATARQRFMREARAAAAVTHEHVVTIHAVEEANGLPYIVMQYVDGMSLQDRLDRTGPLPLREVLRIGMQAAAGLAAAHKQGLVHRDVKPANILLENGVERVKLTDFGLARAADDASLTQAGAVAGTPQYMSPEQAEGKPVDARSDLFSLGSVLYAMCAGTPPFRGSTTPSVLRRVVEDAPRPLCEVNPEVPEWLAAIVGRLHAKDPAGRFQTAAEVADLLGQHLAHLQHPSQVPAPAAVARPATAVMAPARRRSRWAGAAAALVLLTAGLGLTEAAGVTKVRATVIRIFTPDGTLVVEADDPDVKVTIEGDGGLVITGAGPQEVRVRPGSYKVQAVKDGKPVKLDRDLVAITRGDKQIVKVRVEGGPGAAAAAPKAEAGAFVVLGGPGVAEKKFDSLAEAVAGASSGDTIEVRGNGSFVSEPLKLGNVALTIRAGTSYRPVLTLSEKGVDSKAALLHTDAALVLEGLEFLLPKPTKHDGSPYFIGFSGTSKGLVANCRFVGEVSAYHACLAVLLSIQARNCEFLNAGTLAIQLDTGYVDTCHVHNCVVAGSHTLELDRHGPSNGKSTSIHLTNNTLISSAHAAIYVFHNDAGNSGKQPATKPARVEASANIFDAKGVLHTASRVTGTKPVEPVVAETITKGILVWADLGNVFNVPQFCTWDFQGPGHSLKTLAEWKKLWGKPDADACEGQMHYQGGNLSARLAAAPHKLTPEDFRLRPDSAGYRAGKDGKDLGADVDLVGPGAAYERWKKTPEYQQWLKDSGQARAAAPKAEVGPFAVLGVNGAEIRRFDTLAAAVAGASDGDTVEIRGNGPFITDPVTITSIQLTLRAGTGFRPVIRLSPQGAQTYEPLIQSDRHLVVEGLELQRFGQKNWNGGRPLIAIVRGSGPSVHLANCRFRWDTKTYQMAIDAATALCVARNCEFMGPSDSQAIGASGMRPTWLVRLENCVLLCDRATGASHFGSEFQQELQLVHNTLVSVRFPLALGLVTPPGDPAGPTGAPCRVKASANVIDARSVLRFIEEPPWLKANHQLLTEAEAGAMIPKLLAWTEQDNCYAPGANSTVFWCYREPPSTKMLASPDRLCGGSAKSMEGVIRYQGGDLRAKLAAAPEKITPEDFRLRPDSAGYRAGKDGKDLGADIDLVGPGAAYEQWKKTPDYRQWLKDCGQLKK